MRADLTGANLTGAILTGAILVGADLTGANLTGANLRGAKALNHARGLIFGFFQQGAEWVVLAEFGVGEVGARCQASRFEFG